MPRSWLDAVTTICVRSLAFVDHSRWTRATPSFAPWSCQGSTIATVYCAAPLISSWRNWMVSWGLLHASCSNCHDGVVSQPSCAIDSIGWTFRLVSSSSCAWSFVAALMAQLQAICVVSLLPCLLFRLAPTCVRPRRWSNGSTVFLLHVRSSSVCDLGSMCLELFTVVLQNCSLPTFRKKLKTHFFANMNSWFFFFASYSYCILEFDFVGLYC